MATAQKQIKYNTAEKQIWLNSSLNKKRNIYTKYHLERDGASVIVVEDGKCDRDKEIQSELANAGLQNILKLQELRYGTVDNAIARAADRGVYADVSDIPESVGERAEYIQKVNAAVAKLKAELGLSDEDFEKLNFDKIIELYEAKNAPASESGAGSEGGAE